MGYKNVKHGVGKVILGVKGEEATPKIVVAE